MAEVFLARQEGPQGFSKTVVIKRILPSFSKKKEFVRMFLDEARLAALINHPNVSSVYELGEDEKTSSYFIAMEYIDGCDLRRLVRKGHEDAAPLPLTLCAKVIAEACAGLHFAHELHGADDAALSIVHRDVSPENLLVTYSGQVKVADFGIAKAAHLESKTRTGQIKGKISYLSPETLLGEETDRRADVWALGVTLHWACTAQKPFAGKSEGEILQQILNAEPPPLRKLVPGAPKELERIVQKALAKDPERRYRTARELQDELEAWLASTTPKVTSGSVADRMNALFPPKRDPDRMLKNAILAGELPKAKRKKKKGAPESAIDLGVPDFSAELAPREMSELDIVADEPLAPGPTSLDVDLKDERSIWSRGTRTLLRGLLALLAGGALGLLAWQGTVHQAQLLAAASWLMGTERDLASPGGAGRHVPLLAGSSAFALAAIGGAVWLRRARAAKPAPRKRKKSK
jgi:serine/threonine-protein kinase